MEQQKSEPTAPSEVCKNITEDEKVKIISVSPRAVDDLEMELSFCESGSEDISFLNASKGCSILGDPINKVVKQVDETIEDVEYNPSLTELKERLQHLKTLESQLSKLVDLPVNLEEESTLQNTKNQLDESKSEMKLTLENLGSIEEEEKSENPKKTKEETVFKSELELNISDSTIKGNSEPEILFQGRYQGKKIVISIFESYFSIGQKVKIRLKEINSVERALTSRKSIFSPISCLTSFFGSKSSKIEIRIGTVNGEVYVLQVFGETEQTELFMLTLQQNLK